MDIKDQYGDKIDTDKMEKLEQELAQKYIKEDDVVFELGARYGSVSCVINSKLSCKTNQVVVEPDDRVWSALERNRNVNKCKFHIVKGFVSKKKLGLTNMDAWHGGYGATAIESTDSKIPSFTLDDIKKTHGLNFNVLVADCEGFLETFFDENPDFYDSLRLILFEADYPMKCNYEKIRKTLKEKGFKEEVKGHQNVWVRHEIISALPPKEELRRVRKLSNTIITPPTNLKSGWYFVSVKCNVKDDPDNKDVIQHQIATMVHLNSLREFDMGGCISNIVGTGYISLNVSHDNSSLVYTNNTDLIHDDINVRFVGIN